MTIFKKSKAIIASVLAAVTLLACSVYYAYANTESVDGSDFFYCNGKSILCTLTDQSKKASAICSSASKLEALGSSVMATQVDKNGDNPRLKSNSSTREKSNTSGEAKVEIASGSTDYFKGAAGIYTASDGGDEEIYALPNK